MTRVRRGLRHAALTCIVAALIAGGASAQGEGLQPVEALRSGRYDEAITLYERLTERLPASAGAARGLMRSLRAVGRYEEAEEAARRFLERNPGSVQLSNALGEVLLEQGRWDDAGAAFRRAVDGGADDSLTARLNLGVLAYRRGDIARATVVFDGFIDVYNRTDLRRADDLRAVATAVRYLAVRNPDLNRDALRAYDEAIAADPGDLDTQVFVGDLFLEKYAGTDARTAYEQVLERNPRHTGALLGLARTRRFAGSREALELVQRCLEVNPRLVPARVFLATLYVEAEEYDRAESELEQALAVDPRSLEALSVRAAIHMLRGERAAYETLRRRVLALNPQYAEFYATMAEVSQRNRLYREAAEFGREAVRLDTTSWRGYQLLGINELRLGAMREGKEHLETAFRGDPYDAWTKNTLDLLDTLAQYDTVTSPRYLFAMDPKESRLLVLYAAPLAESAYDRLAARYGYAPPGPVRVEIYPSHADFSVRTVGLVGMGALGVSFGSVLAMDSPSARDAGAFNWGSTLWHEIAHAFHLGMTAHRVPRWFTEGLAVLEEWAARPGWGDDVSPAFFVAFRDGRLHPVSQLNNGFLRPAYPEQVAYSYLQAALVCEYIEEEHGTAALAGMLAAYRDGLPTDQAFLTVLGTSLESFDETFDRYLRERFAGPLAALRAAASFEEHGRQERGDLEERARRDPDDFLAQLGMGRQLVERGDDDAALPYLERAVRLFPQYAGPENPYWYLALVHRRQGRPVEAERHLATLTDINGADYQALLALADVREQLDDVVGAASALDRAMFVHPFDVEQHQRLAAHAASLGQWETAVRERRAVLALDPVDRAEAWYQLARAHHGAGDSVQARRAVLRALELAPGFAAAQDLLLELHDAR